MALPPISTLLSGTAECLMLMNGKSRLISLQYKVDVVIVFRSHSTTTDMWRQDLYLKPQI